MMATERQNKQGSGENCAVNGCSWNQRKLNSLLNLPCFDHKSLLKKDCSCAPRYKLHRMPDDPDLKRQWLAALKRKFPPQNLFVCSYHFVGNVAGEQCKLARVTGPEFPHPFSPVGRCLPATGRCRAVRYKRQCLPGFCTMC